MYKLLFIIKHACYLVDGHTRGTVHGWKTLALAEDADGGKGTVVLNVPSSDGTSATEEIEKHLAVLRDPQVHRLRHLAGLASSAVKEGDSAVVVRLVARDAAADEVGRVDVLLVTVKDDPAAVGLMVFDRVAFDREGTGAGVETVGGDAGVH